MRLLPVLGLLCLAACRGPSAAEAATAPRPSDYVRVVDGDTLVVRGERVRLENIDAPEMPPHAKCWAEAALAVHASRMMQGLINETSTLTLTRHGRDRYGRTLAAVTIRNGRDLGETLVGLGVAARWTGHRWAWCSPTRLTDPDGPSLYGASVDDEFMDWVDEREQDRLEQSARDAGFQVRRQDPAH